MLPAPYPILRSPDERYAMREDLLGLARDGVYLAPIVTNRAVRSYRTLSPFPVVQMNPSGVCFLWHFPSFPAAREVLVLERVGVTHRRVLPCSDFPPMDGDHS